MRRTAAPGASQPCPAPRLSRSPRAWCAAALALAALLPLAAHAQTPLPDPYDYDEPVPAPKRVAVPRWQALELGRPGHRYKVPVYANRNLARADLRDIKQIVIVFHGVKRNADAYYETVATLLAANQAPLPALSELGNTPGQVLKPGSMGRPLPGYQVALQSYAAVQQLSLFNYING